MTRSECMKILNDKENPLYKEFIHTFRTNYNNCRKYYDNLGYKGYTLHHKIINCTNYEDWKVDEIEPMLRSEHSRLHMVYYKQGLGSEESRRKAHETLSKKYASGELQIWNKGLTKETDCRIKESNRKGKTGEDFPFLKASKKGKSGGWNKDITSDDPRYKSLLHSEDQNKKQSEFMKNNNPMNNPEYRKKVGESKKGKKKYTNGKETHIFIPGSQPNGYYTLSEFKRIKENNEKEI